MGLEDRFALTNPGPYPGHDLIDAAAFGALLREYARGTVSGAEALNVINMWVQIPLTATEQTDLSSLASLIDAGVTEGDKLWVASLISDVVRLGEEHSVGYSTRAELKSKLAL